MAGRRRADADGGWKDIIQDYTEEFLEFYFPQVHEAVDFSQPVTFLDTELRRIVPESSVSGRHADRLIRVVLKDGSERWLYIHVEVQGDTRETEEQFAERIYVYHYRIGDRYGKSVVSLAVLTDSVPGFHPREYRREFLGNVLSFKFLSVKLADMDAAALAGSHKTFALVTRIQLAANEARRNTQRRFDRKLALTRELYRHGYDRERVVRLFRFLDFLMRLPEPLAIQYRQEVETLEGELKMPYVTSVEKLAKREGRVEGRVEGRREDVIEALEVRFGDIPYELREEIGRVSDLAELKKLLRRAVTVKSLGEFEV